MSYRNPVRSVTATLAGGGAAGPTVRTRASAVGNYGSTNQTQLNVPTSTKAGDLLVAVLTSSINVTLATPSGWTRRVFMTDGSARRLYVDTRTATAGDPGTEWFWNGSSGTYPGIMLVLAGGAAVTLVSRALANSAGDTQLPTGDIDAGTFLLGCSADSGVVNQQPSYARWGWGSSIQGGPPSPVPSWSQLDTSVSSEQLTCAVGASNWTPAASYNAITDGGSQGWPVALLKVTS